MDKIWQAIEESIVAIFADTKMLKFVVALNLVTLGLLKIPQVPNWVSISLPVAVALFVGGIASHNQGLPLADVISNAFIYAGASVVVGYIVHIIIGRFTAPKNVEPKP